MSSKEGETSNATIDTEQLSEQFDDRHHSQLTVFILSIALISAFFISSMDTTIVATAIPRITDEFGAIDDVVWYGPAYFIALGSFQSSSGKVYKHFDPKYGFTASMGFFMGGSLLCALAPRSLHLIVGRAITGVGAAGLATGCFTIFANAAKPERRPLFTAVIGITYGLASILGPILGGLFTDHLGWRWCFWINLPVGGLSITTVLFLFRSPRISRRQGLPWKSTFFQMDPLGIVFTLGALICYVLALQMGGRTHPWNSSDVIGLLCGFIFLLVSLVVWECHAEEFGMLIPRILTKKYVRTSCWFGACLSGSYFVVLIHFHPSDLIPGLVLCVPDRQVVKIYYLPIYFQSVSNLGPTTSAVRNIPLIITVTASMALSTMLVPGTRIVIPTLCVGPVFAAIGAGLLHTLNEGTPAPKWIGYQILGGVGWGLAFQIPIITCQQHVKESDLAPVTAIVLSVVDFSNIGGALFLTAAQAVFANVIENTLPSTAPTANPSLVLSTGATEIRSRFPSDQVPGIIQSYVYGLNGAFILSIAGAGCAFVAAWSFYADKLVTLIRNR